MQHGFGFGPSNRQINDKNRIPKPKSVKEIPSYLRKLTTTFFTRLFYIFGLVWETKPLILVLMVLIALINGILPVVGAYITAQIINRLAESIQGVPVELSALGALFIGQFAYLFFSRVTTEINRILSNLSGEMVTNHIRRKIMRKAKEIDVACFDLPDFYERLENANREAGMRPIQILNASLNIISTTVSMISFIIILINVSFWTPFLVGILALPSAIVNFIFRKKTVNYMRRRSKARRQMNYYSSSVVNKDMVKEMRLLGLNDEFEKRYDSVFADYFSGLKRIILSEGIWNVGFTLLRILVSCSLFFFIAMLVLDKQIQIGDYSYYTGALSSIATGVSTFISGTSTVYEGTLFIENLITFMKQKPSVVPLGEGIMPETGVGHTIEFVDVTFKYPGSDKAVLEHFNFKLEKGETVALVGLNGAGKTTIIKLLTRLYDVTDGVILLDGRDIREYNVKALYDLFGIVFQDFGKYAFTVEENIRFGKINKNADFSQVENASVQSDAKDYIDSLPFGFDTPLTRFFEDEGTELSMGQWQKLAVARAFYSDSDIIILDEPTASLDALAEQEIFRQFDVLRKDKTTLFVSHRLSSAVDADRIVVVKGGKIIEDGNHSRLMEQNGEYARMFEAQAKKYRAKVTKI
ncbi:MAG: ABC transporter ATP-binding protein [Clostridia bacterium]|nr:ABC transporter ATP-binding protein [Clostridia bacterium]